MKCTIRYIKFVDTQFAVAIIWLLDFYIMTFIFRWQENSTTLIWIKRALKTPNKLWKNLKIRVTLF